MQEKVKRKITARGLRRLPVAKEGVNHRGNPSGRRYSIIPSRAVYCAELSPNDFLLLATLGLFVSRQGVSFPTYETIKNCSGLGPVQVSASIKRLVRAGMIRKLQPRWFKNQSSKWLTSRYQVLFSSSDPIPTDEELQASIPFASDQPDEPEVIKIINEPIKEVNNKLIGIERDVKAIAQTYGHNISTDANSLERLANLNVTKDQLAHGFRTYLTRFGSLPPSLAVLLDRGVFA